jgi:hypothetical protein
MNFVFDWKLFKDQKKYLDNAAINLMLKSKVSEVKCKEDQLSP